MASVLIWSNIIITHTGLTTYYQPPPLCQYIWTPLIGQLHYAARASDAHMQPASKCLPAEKAGSSQQVEIREQVDVTV